MCRNTTLIIEIIVAKGKGFKTVKKTSHNAEFKRLCIIEANGKRIHNREIIVERVKINNSNKAHATIHKSLREMENQINTMNKGKALSTDNITTDLLKDA